MLNALISFLAYTFLLLCVLLLGLRFYMKGLSAWNKSYKCLLGKTCIVTGANTGIGYWTALDFAKRGANVILACRKEDLAKEACAKIIKETGNEYVSHELINLHSMKSVKEFCKKITSKYDSIDILVNNAGAAGMNAHLTEDGFDITWQTNYLSPFLLTNLLLPQLKASKSARIVNVSSLAAKWSKFNTEEIGKFPKTHKKLSKNMSDLYAWTKQGNILFSRELAYILKDSNVSVYALHPGVILTDIFRRLPKWQLTIAHFLLTCCCKTAEQGAQTSIYCAVSNDCAKSSGKLYAECQEVDMYENCVDTKFANDVWKKTESLLKEHLM